MDISTIANLINAIAVTAGVIFAAVYLVSLTWESLGVLVYRREVTLDLVDDFFSGPLVISWQKLKIFSEEWRSTLNRETGNEWFHWLAERMLEREKNAPPIPAYVAHRHWS